MCARDDSRSRRRRFRNLTGSVSGQCHNSEDLVEGSDATSKYEYNLSPPRKAVAPRRRPTELPIVSGSENVNEWLQWQDLVAGLGVSESSLFYACGFSMNIPRSLVMIVIHIASHFIFPSAIRELICYSP